MDWSSFWLGFAAAYGASVLACALYLALVQTDLPEDRVGDWW